MGLRRVLGIIGAVAVSLTASAGAQAATYTVDSTADIAGIANCMPAVANDCPLRGAVQNANNTPVSDTIVLTVNPQLQLNDTDESVNANGDIDINATSGGPLTIRSDTGVRTISRSNIANNFRILEISVGANTVVLEDVEITTGNQTTSTLTGGGGIRYTAFDPASVLRLDNVNVHDNAVGGGANDAHGGGVSAGGGGLLEVVGGSRIEDNLAANAIAGSKGFGGGISATGSMDLTVSGSTIAGNRAGSGGGPTEGRGGGIYVFNATPTTTSLTLTGSQIQGNRAGGFASTGNFYFGGGIYAEAQGGGAVVDTSITGGALTGNTVGGGSGNSQGIGGGVRVFGNSGSGGGELTLDGVSVTGNRAGGTEGDTNPTMMNLANGIGAGLASNVDTTVTNSVVSGNRAGIIEGIPSLSTGGSGAGIFMDDLVLLMPDLTITGTRLEDNRGGNGNGGSSSGGGIAAFNEGTVAITNSVIAGNQTKGSGGGILRSINTTGSPDTIADTSITGNVAGNAGGGLDVSTPRLITIDRSLVSGNATNQFGGGISATSTFGASPLGQLRLRNSTVTGNSAGLDTPTGSLLAAGGGIAIGAAEETDFVATLSTIASNTVFSGISTDPSYGRGGNIRVFNDLDAGSPSTGFAGTIVSGGEAITTDNSATPATSPNCSLGANITTTSAGGNLEDLTSCGFTNTGLGDQTGVDPMLAPLADNGGPTRTRALLPGSPAINAVPAAVCTPTGLTIDQRGEPRPFAGGLCDAGAYELGDRDGDGLLDTSDGCPTQSGPNNGCPLPAVTPPPDPPVQQPAPAKKCKKAKKKKGKKAVAAAKCKKKKAKKKK